MTLRNSILKNIKDNSTRALLASIPEGYSIKQAETEGIVSESDGLFLATFISVNWETLYNSK